MCENNNYSCYTDLIQRQNHSEFSKYAQSFGIESIISYGNDVEDVRNTFLKAYNKCKKHSPYFIQFDTFRFLEHCGPSNDDHLNYRNETEIIYWNKNCPVKSFKNKLTKENIISNTEIIKIEKLINKEIEQAFNHARLSKLPTFNDKFIRVYN